ncbi:putative bifunctional diguanylate cyclase/phosphodiesterase [Sphingomonas sp. IW22]|uniref:putative bifunctional diguanylate cyclase/phosphodiesterase n=1 Tax=Sphingomonas sp. IW22 TaxID=3242489 RepID=UPI0035212C16
MTVISEIENPSAERLPLQVTQLQHLRRQIPPLYALLAVNASALAFTHRHVAPTWLTLGVAGILVTICLVRLLAWALPTKDGLMTIESAEAQMRRTTLLGIVLAAAFVSWALVLDQYGGPYEHGHVAMFVGVTVLGCVFCLSYLPRAAMIVCGLVIGTFLLYCFLRGPEALIAIAINLALVSLVIIKVLNDSFSSFLKLEQSQQDLYAERQQANRLNEENRVLAHTDALTGLPNRRSFFNELDRLLESGSEEMSVGVIDLDRFKPINDMYGHTQGDHVLRVLGKRLLNIISHQVTIARLGGDEFGLLVSAESSVAIKIGDAICEAIKAPISAGDTVLSVGCSLGLAALSEAGDTAHDLFDHADAALYQAKERRKGGCVLYTKDMGESLESGKSVDSALQSANLGRELSVVFQPIYDSRSLDIVAYEALARWNSPKLGLVPAEVLISAAERTGMMNGVTLILFDKALDGLRFLPYSKRVSFNLSALDLICENTVSSLLSQMQKSGVCSSNIIFELTGSSLITDMAAAESSLKALRDGGCMLALDDFGTGYSSLSSLHRLPFHYIKIDRSFTSRLSGSEGRKIIAAIRGLAQSLSLKCVLEGIETENQLIEAGLIGIDYVQGYYLSRPCSSEELYASSLVDKAV